MLLNIDFDKASKSKKKIRWKGVLGRLIKGIHKWSWGKLF